MRGVRAVQPMSSNPLAEPHQRVGQHSALNPVVREHSRRMIVRPRDGFLHVHDASVPVEPHDLPEFLVLCRVQVHQPDLALLRRKRIPIDCHTPLRHRQALDEREVGQCLRLVEVVLRRQVGEPEELPPDRLVLAPVEVQEVREQVSRLLFWRSLDSFIDHAVQEARRQRLDSQPMLVQRLARLRGCWEGPRHLVPRSEPDAPGRPPANHAIRRQRRNRLGCSSRWRQPCPASVRFRRARERVRPRAGATKRREAGSVARIRRAARGS